MIRFARKAIASAAIATAAIIAFPSASSAIYWRYVDTGKTTGAKTYVADVVYNAEGNLGHLKVKTVERNRSYTIATIGVLCDEREWYLMETWSYNRRGVYLGYYNMTDIMTPNSFIIGSIGESFYNEVCL
jgi:hypothetical protein